MTDQPVPADPRQLRAADTDRDHTAEVLRRAAAEGRITFEELDERIGQAYAAKTFADLEALTRDLPGAGVRPRPGHAALSATRGPRGHPALILGRDHERRPAGRTLARAALLHCGGHH